MVSRLQQHKLEQHKLEQQRLEQHKAGRLTFDPPPGRSDTTIDHTLRRVIVQRHPVTVPPSAGRRTRWLGVAGAITLVGALSLFVPLAGRASASPTAPSAGHSWVRFGHFASGQGPVEVRIDGVVVTSSAKFETVTPYQSVPAGAVTVIVTSLATPSVHLTDEVNVAAGDAITVAALRQDKALMLRTFDDNLSAAPAGDAKVRIVDADYAVHFMSAKFATVVSKVHKPAVAAGTFKVLNGVAYASASSYLAVAAGHYNVTIANKFGKTVLVGRDWPVAAGTVASLVVVRSSAGPTLEVLDDAAGSAAAPSGGMQTGFGGTSLPSSHGDIALPALVGLVALLLIGDTWRRRREAHLAFSPGDDSGGLKRHYPTGAVAAAAAVGLVVVAGGCGAVSEHPNASRPAARPAVAEGAPQSAHVAPLAVTPKRSVPRAARSTDRRASARSRHGATRHSAHHAMRTVAARVNLSKLGTAPASAPAPTALAIPSIGVSAPIVSLGRNADGTAQVPATTTVAGWYDQGPVPGQRGPAVILGHVDSISGPGIFYDLKDLKPGALINVTEAGRTLTFSVQQVEIYSKTAFPTQAVFGPTPARALRLVTCGGPFDYSTGHYYDNVVAYATEVL
jgi:sortase (surface protein transpeptidase)